MRKYLRYGNLIALGAGALGMLLSAWMFGVGVDEKGLYPANHPAWILLGILTAAVAVVCWLMSRQAGPNRNFRQNFPCSILGACGYALAAVGLLSGGTDTLTNGNTLGLATGVVGIVAGIPLVWAAICRLRGQRCNLPVHTLPCFFFTLQLFVLGQQFGAEPEMCRYLYRFWAAATMVPACYLLWSFDVNLGKRPDCIFWCLVAGYSNLVAAVGSGQWLLHLGVAAWMLTALPKLGYLPKPPKPAAQPVAAEEPAQTATISSEEIHPTADPLAVDLPDAEAILKELLQDLGQSENN